MITVGSEHLSANEFRDALSATPPGGVVVYFTGELSRDLSFAALNKDPGFAELRLVARMAMEGSDAGELALTQRRLDGCRFEYRATKVRPAFRPRSLEKRATPRRAALLSHSNRHPRVSARAPSGAPDDAAGI